MSGFISIGVHGCIYEFGVLFHHYDAMRELVTPLVQFCFLLQSSESSLQVLKIAATDKVQLSEGFIHVWHRSDEIE